MIGDVKPKSQEAKRLDAQESGGSGGVGEDIGNNSERFNDYSHNTATGSHSYLHIEGSYNTASGGYCVSIGGYGNTLTNGYYSNIHGSSNACAYAYGSTICGVNNVITNASRCGVWGYNNTIKGSNSLVCGENNTLTNRTGSSNGADGCIICGEYNTVSYDGNIVCGDQNNVSSVYNIVGGEFNTVSDRLNIVSGNTNTVAGTRCLVAGQGNNVQSGAQDSVIVGEYNTTNTGNAYCALIAGKYANINSSDRIVIGNGNNNSPANAFRVNDYGKVYASEYNTSGADYAEYFEWADGNPDSEDRRGMLVQIIGDKIAPAHGDEILGAVSARPSAVGNAYEDEWRGKYKRDIFGAYILDADGKRQLSDDYDKEREYIPRSQRQEWAAIGLVGRLIIRDNGKCEPGGYVTARQGVGTPTFKETRARCIRRLDESHIEIIVR